MRSARAFVDLPLDAHARATLPPGPSQHLTQVLRLRPGDPLVLFNGDGRDYPARMHTPDRGAAVVEIHEPGDPEPPARLRLHLGLGVSKGERMDFALQKAVELGVEQISPLFTERSVVRLAGERLAKRWQHWQGVVIAACEQSGRRRLPRLHAAAPLDVWLARGHPTALLLDPRSDTPMPAIDPPEGGLVLLVGPEGGLAEHERALARRHGFLGVRLGPRILRTETAPLAALAVAQALWGDLAL